MDTTGSEDYRVNGNQIYYKDIYNDLNLDTWPASTRIHSKKGGHYVYFKTKDSKSSFLTKRDFQTQLGRQIVFEIEKETNEEMNIFYKNEMNNNNFANIWKWQEFSFKKNMINTMIDLRPHLLDIKKNDPKFEFKTF